MTKYVAIFETACPITKYYVTTPATAKSFVRVVDHVRSAAVKYNRVNHPDFNDMNYFKFNYIQCYNERNDEDKVVARMVYTEGNTVYTIIIVEK